MFLLIYKILPLRNSYIIHTTPGVIGDEICDEILKHRHAFQRSSELSHRTFHGLFATKSAMFSSIRNNPA
ncbi:hypothetical protein [Methanospirillum sp.]|uniref:hypothetical protein n=1 Tax=Methanospirillum sp. TaxID=45200 RepID=UPI0035A119E6